MVQAYAAADRIDSFHLSESQPSPEEIRDTPIDVVLASQQEIATFKEELQALVERVIVRRVPAFNHLTVPEHIMHRYSVESAKKTRTVINHVIFLKHDKGKYK